MSGYLIKRKKSLGFWDFRDFALGFLSGFFQDLRSRSESRFFWISPIWNSGSRKNLISKPTLIINLLVQALWQTWTDTGENVQKWTQVFSTRRWVILVARTRRKKEKKITCPLLDVFACGQVSSPRLYRLNQGFLRDYRGWKISGIGWTVSYHGEIISFY